MADIDRSEHAADAAGPELLEQILFEEFPGAGKAIALAFGTSGSLAGNDLADALEDFDAGRIVELGGGAEGAERIGIEERAIPKEGELLYRKVAVPGLASGETPIGESLPSASDVE